MADYRPRQAGLKELAQSDWMKNTVMEVGRKMAGNANAVGESTYEAKSVKVRAGWANEQRQGASVSEVEKHWKDSRDGVLLRVAERMKIRGRR